MCSHSVTEQLLWGHLLKKKKKRRTVSMGGLETNVSLTVAYSRPSVQQQEKSEEEPSGWTQQWDKWCWNERRWKRMSCNLMKASLRTPHLQATSTNQGLGLDQCLQHSLSVMHTDTEQTLPSMPVMDMGHISVDHCTGDQCFFPTVGTYTKKLVCKKVSGHKTVVSCPSVSGKTDRCLRVSGLLT